MPSQFVFHIAHRTVWEKTKSDYRPDAFSREGFVHCSYTEQVVASGNKHFPNARDLVLLKLDPSALGSDLKIENGFPHVHRALVVSDVLETIPFESYEGYGFALPARAGESLFSKIVRGEIPSYRLFEDEWTFSFLTRDAIQPGHCLVIPKIEVSYFADVPEPYYSAVFRTGKKLAGALKLATDCDRVAAIIAGWEIPHFHLHLIPAQGMADLEFRRGKVRSHEENIAVQERVIKSLGNSLQ